MIPASLAPLKVSVRPVLSVKKILYWFFRRTTVDADDSPTFCCNSGACQSSIPAESAESRTATGPPPGPPPPPSFSIVLNMFAMSFGS